MLFKNMLRMNMSVYHIQPWSYFSKSSARICSSLGTDFSFSCGKPEPMKHMASLHSRVFSLPSLASCVLSHRAMGSCFQLVPHRRMGLPLTIPLYQAAFLMLSLSEPKSEEIWEIKAIIPLHVMEMLWAADARYPLHNAHLELIELDRWIF